MLVTMRCPHPTPPHKTLVVNVNNPHQRGPINPLEMLVALVTFDVGGVFLVTGCDLWHCVPSPHHFVTFLSHLDFTSWKEFAAGWFLLGGGVTISCVWGHNPLGDMSWRRGTSPVPPQMVVSPFVVGKLRHVGKLVFPTQSWGAAL